MKPAKFHRSGPHLPVTNLKQTLAYYRNILGFGEEWSWGEKDGGICRDDMRLLFAEDPLFTTTINTNSKRMALVWFVDNIDEVYAEFNAKGIEIADPLKKHPYEMREFAFIDINGYYIRVAEETGKE